MKSTIWARISPFYFWIGFIVFLGGLTMMGGKASAQPSAAIDIIGPTETCLGVPQTFTTTLLPNWACTWTAVNGDIISGQGTNTIVAVWNTSGPNAIQLSAIDGAVVISDTLSILSHIPPSIDLGPSGAYCGQNLALSPGAGYASYLWCTGDLSDTLRPNAPGTYWVQVVDSNGCEGHDSVVLANGVPQPAIYPPGPIDICEGNSTMLFAPGGFESYLWNGLPGGQVAMFGESITIAITVIDSLGCTAVSDPVQITMHAAPVPTITAVGDTLFASPAVSYRWMRDGIVIPATTQSFVPQQSGNFTVRVTDANGCEGTSDPYYHSVVGMPDRLSTTLTVWPNPSKGDFHVEIPDGLGAAPQAELFDRMGRVVEAGFAMESETRMLMKRDDLAAGIYMLRVAGEAGSAVVKIVLE